MRTLRAMLVLTHRGVYRRSAGAIKALRRSLPLSATVAAWATSSRPEFRKNRLRSFTGIWSVLRSVNRDALAFSGEKHLAIHRLVGRFDKMRDGAGPSVDNAFSDYPADASGRLVEANHVFRDIGGKLATGCVHSDKLLSRVDVKDFIFVVLTFRALDREGDAAPAPKVNLFGTCGILAPSERDEPDHQEMSRHTPSKPKPPFCRH